MTYNFGFLYTFAIRFNLYSIGAIPYLRLNAVQKRLLIVITKPEADVASSSSD